MTQTPAQKAADEALRDALQAFDVAYSPEGEQPDGMMVDIMVIYSRQGFNNSGESFTRYDWAVPGDGMPYHRMIGLLEIARMQVNHTMASSEE